MSKQEKSRKPLIIGIIAAVVILAVLIALLLTQCVGGQGGATVPTTTAPTDEVAEYQLYWNLDRAEYDGKSEAGMSSRMPEADGYFHVRFFCEGEELTLKVADRKLINAIDVQSLMGLEFDEDGIVVGVLNLDDMPLEKVGWQFYVQSAARTMIKLNSSESLNGMEVLLEKLDPNRIWDMSGKSGTPGVVTEAIEYDKVMAVQNQAGQVTHVFIYERPNYMLSHEAYCEHCKETVKWQEWIKTESMPMISGHFQLQTDVQLKTQASLPEDVKMCLDLNGHRIDGKQTGGRVIAMFNPGITLAIMDTSEEQTGVVAAHQKVDQGGVVWVRYGAFYLYSGTLDASDAYGEKGGIAVDCGKEKFFYMYGGTIIGGRATYTYNAEKNTYGAGTGGAVSIGGKFVMHDGVIRDGHAEAAVVYKDGKLSSYQRGLGGNLMLSGTAEFEMNGGSIMYGRAGSAGGNIYADGTVEMHLNGGSIVGGMIYGKGKNGGSIFVGSKATMNLNGTSIYGGVSYNCGGNVYLNGTLNMSGGYIGGGSCYNFDTRKLKETESSANLFVVNGKLNMGGGTIAGHVGVTDSKKDDNKQPVVNLYGVPRIDGSKVGRNLTITNTNDGTKVLVNYLYKGAKIGVNTTIGIFTEPTKAEYKQYFFSDIEGADILHYQDRLALGRLNCICGKSHDDVVSEAHINGCKGELLLWAPWTSDNTVPTTTGNYFLTKDVTTKKQYNYGNAQDVKLDLNGKNITLQVQTNTRDGWRLYRPEAGSKLSITDTTDKPGALRTFMPAEDAEYTGGKFTVKTKVDGKDVEIEYTKDDPEGQAYVKSLWQKGNFGMLVWVRGGEFNLHNGILDGTNLTGAQSGMVINIGDMSVTDEETGETTVHDGVFNMYGGTVLGGYTKADGNISVGSKTEMNMYGGTISGGRANVGGNINVLGTLNMYGGTITKGVVDRSEEEVDGGLGGNIQIAYTNAKTFGVMNMYGGTVSDGVVVAGKKGGGHGGNICVYGQLNANGGTVSGGSASGAGGNIGTISTNSVITLNGVKVLDGEAVVGGNVAVHVRSNKGLYLLGNTVISGGRATGIKDAGGGNVAVVSAVQGADQDQIVVIDGATIENGTAAGNGGNIFVRNASYDRTVVDEKTGKEKQDRHEIKINVTVKSGTISGGVCGLNDDGTRRKVNGGSIYTTSKVNLTIEDGTITGGDCSDGGGNIYTNGVLTIKGGTISGGTRLGENGGSGNIFLVNGTLDISGGVIEGDVSATATKTGAVKILLSGKPVIKKHVDGMKLSGFSGAKAPVVEIDGVLNEGSEIFITGSGYISTETPVENMAFFKSESDTIIHYNKCLFIGRSYCICGKSHDDTVSDTHINGCDGTVYAWERWTSTSTLPIATGNFYLSADVTTTAQTTVPAGKDVRVNLDGHNVTLKVPTNSRDAWRLYRADNGATLAITDTTDKPGTLKTVMPDADAEYTGGKFTVETTVDGETVKTEYTGKDEASKAYVKKLWKNGNFGMLLWARGGEITVHNGIFDGTNLSGNKSGQVISIGNSEVTDAETGEKTLYIGKFNLYGGEIRLGHTTANGGISVGSAGTSANLCGGTIYGGTANIGGAVYAAPDTQLLIDGVQIVGGHALSNGGNIYVSGKLEMKSGVVRDGTAYGSAGNLYMTSTADVTISGGTISGGANGVADDGTRRAGINGGSMYQASKSVLNISGGEILGGDTANGGGNLYTNGIVNITGGTISGGNMKGGNSSSANIFAVNATLNISGGEINGDVGCTATRTDGLTITLSGKPVIKQAYTGLSLGIYDDPKDDKVVEPYYINIDGILEEGASVALDGTGYVSNETPAENAVFFNSINDSVLHFNERLFVGRAYCICGKTHGTTVSDIHINGCDGTVHGWQRWTSKNTLPVSVGFTTGNFYLPQDVTTTGQSTVHAGNDIRVDLNGHNITLKVPTNSRDAWRLYRADNGATLAITDTTDKPGTLKTVMPDADAEYTGGKFTVETKVDGETVKTEYTGKDEASKAYVKKLWKNGNFGMLLWARGGEITVHNAILDGSNLSGNQGGQAINIGNSEVTDAETGEKTLYVGKFSFYNGEIHLGQTTGNGGISVGSAGTSANIYGGTIYGGTAENGGAIYVGAKAELLLDGANIIGGEKIKGTEVIGGTARFGGLIYSAGNFEMKSGTLTGGAANRHINLTGEAGNGGNVHITGAGSFTMSGGTISKGLVYIGNGGGNGGNIYVAGKLTATGGEILEGSANTGGNIGTNSSTAEILLDGVKVLDGTSSGVGGNIGNNVRPSKSLIITDKTTVSGGEAKGNGGNIYVGVGGTGAKSMNIEIACDVTGGISGGSGGNIYISNGSGTKATMSVTITGNITGGTANTYGGNIYLGGAKVDGEYLTTVSIHDNEIRDGVINCATKANASGANIFLSNVDAAITAATIADGVTHGTDETTTNANSSITYYHAHGGNMHVTGGKLVVDSTAISGGVAESGNQKSSYSYGGNFYLESCEVMMKNGTTVTGGTVSNRYTKVTWHPAGNIFINKATLKTEDTVISGGVGYGGASNLYMNAAATAKVELGKGTQIINSAEGGNNNITIGGGELTIEDGVQIVNNDGLNARNIIIISENVTTVTMNGGEITGGNFKGNGGNICVDYTADTLNADGSIAKDSKRDHDVTININGGTITNGYAANGFGGNMYINQNTVVTIGGDAIVSDGRAYTSGGNIQIANVSTAEGGKLFLKDNAQIVGGINAIDAEGNRVKHGASGTSYNTNGGSIFAGVGSVIDMSGNAKITGGDSVNAGGNLYTNGLLKLSDDATIENGFIRGTQTSGSANAFLVSGILEMDGGLIDGNVSITTTTTTRPSMVKLSGNAKILKSTAGNGLGMSGQILKKDEGSRYPFPYIQAPEVLGDDAEIWLTMSTNGIVDMVISEQVPAENLKFFHSTNAALGIYHIDAAMAAADGAEAVDYVYSTTGLTGQEGKLYVGKYGCLCGSDSDEHLGNCAGDKKVWRAWNALASSGIYELKRTAMPEESGYWYLLADVTAGSGGNCYLRNQTERFDIVIDFNGYSVKANTWRLFDFLSSPSIYLTLCNSRPESGKLYSNQMTTDQGALIWGGKEVSLYNLLVDGSALTLNKADSKKYLSGVCISNSGKLNLFGNTTILGGDSRRGKSALEIAGQLTMDPTVVIDGEILVGDSGKINMAGITDASMYTVNASGIFTNGNTITDSDKFFKPNTDVEIFLDGAEQFAGMQYCICGGAEGKHVQFKNAANETVGCDGTMLNWRPVRSNSNIPTGNGNWYLIEDVNRTSNTNGYFSKPNTNYALNLNGHTINFAPADGKGYRLFRVADQGGSVPNDVVLTITDFSMADGKATGTGAINATVATGGQDGVIFWITKASHQLNIYGGTFNASNVVMESGKGGTVLKVNGGNVNIYGGTLVGGEAKSSGGTISLSGNTELNMYTGTVRDGSTAPDTTYSGGNIYISNNAVMNLYGGTVSGGKTTGKVQDSGDIWDGYGGNIHVIGTLNMYGGVIRDGSANSGDNLCVRARNANEDGTFNMFGGTVAGGITVDQRTTSGSAGKVKIALAGEPVIDKAETSADAAKKPANSLVLTSGVVLDVTGLTGGKIGVKATGKFGLATEGNVDAARAAFVSENDDKSEEIVIHNKTELHFGRNYCLCGASKVEGGVHTYWCDGNHSWIAWNYNTTNVSGYYYLTKTSNTHQVEFGQNAPVNATIDLNGYEWNGTNRAVRLVKSGSTLSITDTSAAASATGVGTGKLTGAFNKATDHSGVILAGGSTVNLYAGTVEHRGDAKVNEGGIMAVAANAELNIYGGKLTGGNANNGGNLYVREDGTVNHYGGSIEGGTATNGGNVFVAEGGNFNVYVSDKDTGNTAERTISGGSAELGGNIYAVGNLTMDIGTVSEGSASLKGGNIYADGAKISIKNATVTKGVVTCVTADNASAGNMYLVSSDTSIVGSTISDGVTHGTDETYTDKDGKVSYFHAQAGNIHVAGGKLVLDDTDVSGGIAESGNQSKSYSYGGNFYLDSCEVTMKNGTTVTGGTVSNRYTKVTWHPAGNIFINRSTLKTEDTIISGGVGYGSASNIYMNASGTAKVQLGKGTEIINSAAGGSNSISVGGGELTIADGVKIVNNDGITARNIHVLAENTCTITMNGGEITGGHGSGNGGNIYFEYSTAATSKRKNPITFTMNGGSITNGYADGGDGGNLWVWRNTDITITGDSIISGGQATGVGGNIRVNDGTDELNSTIVVSGNAQILGGKNGAKGGSHNGGSISMNINSTLSLEDNAKIIGGDATNCGGNLYVNGTLKLSDNAEISGGLIKGKLNAGNHANIFVVNGTLEMDGGVVDGSISMTTSADGRQAGLKLSGNAKILKNAAGYGITVGASVKDKATGTRHTFPKIEAPEVLADGAEIWIALGGGMYDSVISEVMPADNLKFFHSTLAHSDIYHVDATMAAANGADQVNTPWTATGLTGQEGKLYFGKYGCVCGSETAEHLGTCGGTKLVWNAWTKLNTSNGNEEAVGNALPMTTGNWYLVGKVSTGTNNINAISEARNIKLDLNGNSIESKDNNARMYRVFSSPNIAITLTNSRPDSGKIYTTARTCDQGAIVWGAKLDVYNTIIDGSKLTANPKKIGLVIATGKGIGLYGSTQIIGGTAAQGSALAVESSSKLYMDQTVDVTGSIFVNEGATIVTDDLTDCSKYTVDASGHFTNRTVAEEGKFFTVADGAAAITEVDGKQYAGAKYSCLCGALQSNDPADAVGVKHVAFTDRNGNAVGCDGTVLLWQPYRYWEFPNASKNFYLVHDLQNVATSSKAGKTLSAANLVLDLNGHNIYGAANERVLNMTDRSNQTLTITDTSSADVSKQGKIIATGSSANNGGIFYVYATGAGKKANNNTINIYGGTLDASGYTITNGASTIIHLGGNSSTGQGTGNVLNIFRGAALGGNLTGAEKNGAGIQIPRGNTVNIYDGTVTGAEGKNWGGNFCVYGTLNLFEGASVAGGKAPSGANIGLISVTGDAELYVRGATIDGGIAFNDAGYSNGYYGKLILAGAPTIYSGAVDGVDHPGYGVKLNHDNIDATALAGGKIHLSGSGKLGITAQTNNDKVLAALVSENTDKTDEIVIHNNNELHIGRNYCLCGASKVEGGVHTYWCDGNHSWIAWNYGTTNVSGYYYLTKTSNTHQVEFGQNEAVNATIDLNGFEWNGNNRAAHLVKSGSTLSITDTSAAASATGVGTGKLTGAFNKDTDHSGVILAGASTVNLYSGTIEHRGDAKVDKGGIMAVGGNAVFNIYGGTLTGGNANYGGNLYVRENGTVNHYGGSIEGGTATYGGNVYVDGNGTFNVNVSDKDTGNTAERTISGGVANEGGNIYSKGDVTIQTGTISGGTAVNGGNVFVSNGNFTLTGANALIRDGKAHWNANGATGSFGYGGNIRINGGELNLLNGAQVLGGESIAKTATGWSPAGSIYANGGTVNVENATVSGGQNTAAGLLQTATDGNNLYINYDATVNLKNGAVIMNTANNKQENITMQGGVLNMYDGSSVVNAQGVESRNINMNAQALLNKKDDKYTFAYTAKHPVLNMQGGTISGGYMTAGSGANIFMDALGQVNITGGTVSGGITGLQGGNIFVNTVGEAVLTAYKAHAKGDPDATRYDISGKVTIGGTAQIVGGQSIAPKADSRNGGNIHMGQYTTLTLGGNAVISGGQTNNGGGNIYTNANAKLLIKESAVVTGGKAGLGGTENFFTVGSHVEISGGVVHGGFTINSGSSGSLKLSGAPVINKELATANKPATSLRLSTDNAIIDATGLTGGQVYVTAKEVGSKIAVNAAVSAKDYILSEMKYGSITVPTDWVEGEKALYIGIAEDKYCLCGANRNGNTYTCHCDGTSKVWVRWEDKSSLPTETGNYYLAYNVSLTKDTVKAPANGAKIAIDLRGNSIVLDSDERLYNFASKTASTVILTDSSKDDASVGSVISSGTLTRDGGIMSLNESNVFEMYRVTIDASGLTGGNGIQGGVAFVSNGGKMVIHSGTIKSANIHEAGAVIVYTKGDLVMNGGTVQDGVAAFGAGGNIVLSGENVTFTMNGGLIKNGIGASGAGNIGVSHKATFIMNDGEISGGHTGPTKTDAGGNIRLTNGAIMQVNGGVIKHGSVDKDKGLYNDAANIYIQNSTLEVTGGEIWGGVAGGYHATATVKQDPFIKLSGKPVIDGRLNVNAETGMTALKSISLWSGLYIDVTGTLESGSVIGLNNVNKVFSTVSAANEAGKGAFFADNGDQEICVITEAFVAESNGKFTDADVGKLYIGQVHCVCGGLIGGTNEICDHSLHIWHPVTAIPAKSTFKADTSYYCYLTQEITSDTAEHRIYVPNYHLYIDLNGQNVTSNAFRLFTFRGEGTDGASGIPSNSSLVITNTAATKPTLTMDGSADQGRLLWCANANGTVSNNTAKFYNFNLVFNGDTKDGSPSKQVGGLLSIACKTTLNIRDVSFSSTRTEGAWYDGYYLYIGADSNATIINSSLTGANVCKRNDGEVAESFGGGAIYNIGTLLLDNTSITGNYSEVGGGGVQVRGNGVVTVAGNTVITGNTNATGACNLNMVSGTELRISDSFVGNVGLSGDENVALIKAPRKTTDAIIKDHIVADNASQKLADLEEGIILTNIDNIIQCACGGKVAAGLGGHQHDLLVFKPWTDADAKAQTGKEDATAAAYLPASGNWYLTSDVSLKGATKVYKTGNVLNLDLHGKVVTQLNNDRLFTTYDTSGDNKNMTLSITDSVGGGKLVAANKVGYNQGGVIWLVGSGNTLNLYAGTLDGSPYTVSNVANYEKVGGNGSNKDQAKITDGKWAYTSSPTAEKNGGAMVVGAGNTFKMYGGTVVGSTSSNVAKSIKGSDGNTYSIPATYSACAGTMEVSGTVYMYGGTISGGKAYRNGGNIRISGTNAAFYMQGGTVTGGQALTDNNRNATTFKYTRKTSQGGNFWVNSNAKLIISGGTIENGLATDCGGNIHSSGGTVEISGNASIINGKRLPYTYTGNENDGFVYTYNVANAAFAGNSNLYTVNGTLKIYGGIMDGSVGATNTTATGAKIYVHGNPVIGNTTGSSLLLAGYASATSTTISNPSVVVDGDIGSGCSIMLSNGATNTVLNNVLVVGLKTEAEAAAFSALNSSTYKLTCAKTDGQETYQLTLEPINP